MYCTLLSKKSYFHYYRYLAYGQLGDKVAYQMRRGCKMSPKEMALLAVQKLQREKMCFYDFEWQSVQGKKTKKNFKNTKTNSSMSKARTC